MGYRQLPFVLMGETLLFRQYFRWLFTVDFYLSLSQILVLKINKPTKIRDIRMGVKKSDIC